GVAPARANIQSVLGNIVDGILASGERNRPGAVDCRRTAEHAKDAQVVGHEGGRAVTGCRPNSPMAGANWILARPKNRGARRRKMQRPSELAELPVVPSQRYG